MVRPLDIAVLRRFSAARRAAVLRAWIARAGFRAPNERHLHEIKVMLAARRTRITPVAAF